MKQIDCRGLACPQPVITTKKALGEMAQGQLTVIVDNPSARDNVERFAKSQGAMVNIEKKGNDFYLHIEKKSACDLVASTQKVEKVVVYINSDVLGVERRGFRRYPDPVIPARSLGNGNQTINHYIH